MSERGGEKRNVDSDRDGALEGAQSDYHVARSAAVSAIPNAVGQPGWLWIYVRGDAPLGGGVLIFTRPIRDALQAAS